MRPTPETLLEELVGRWAHGEPLGIDELLARAGPQADELAGLIEAFLQRAPRREPSAEAIAYVRSLDEPSLLRARQERRLKLDDLTDLVVAGLGLPASARARVRRYYQQLELGQLDTARIATRVWETLSSVLAVDARKLATVRPAAPAAAPMYREANRPFAAHHEASVEESADLALERAPEQALEEVDRLFGIPPGE